MKSLYTEMQNICRSFSYNTWIAFTITGTTGRVVDFGLDESRARYYKRLGQKSGVDVQIAEYNVADGSFFYD